VLVSFQEEFRGRTATVDETLARIMDANCNRTREALRVIEDVLRFHIEDPGLSSSLKDLRHEVSAGCDTALKADLGGLRARNVASDPGRDSMTGSEASRADFREILISNFRRAQEGLRVLEETAKLVDTGLSRRFKRMRFTAYSLEKSCLLAVEDRLEED
jgi:thiamine-phosphate pyrophosphorylase